MTGGDASEVRFPSAAELIAESRGSELITEWETAISAAGEIVTSFEFGACPDSMAMPRAATIGTGAPWLRRPSVAPDLPARPAEGLLEVEHYAAVWAAAKVAVHEAMGMDTEIEDWANTVIFDPPDDELDERLADIAGMAASGEGEDAEEWLSDAISVAEQIVRDRWQQVEAIACALMGGQTLTASQLKALACRGRKLARPGTVSSPPPRSEP